MRETQEAEAGGEDARFDALRASLREKHTRSRSREKRDIQQAYCRFERHDTEHGAAFARTTRFALDHRHGSAPISGGFSVGGEALADLTLDDALRDVDSRSLVYIDTETTGLAGGAGTIPFLTGLSWFEDDALVVLQVIVLDPGEERAALRLVADRFRLRRPVVSFNGKSFDWPLLRTRFLLGRVACPAPSAHIDLLHVARRLHAHDETLPDRRLQTFERRVLGFAREGDLPGAEIPEVYRRFLRERDVDLIEPILEHNLHDLVALPALLGHCAQVLQAGSAIDHETGQLWALAKLCNRRGQSERAILFAQRCAESTDDADLRVRAHLLMARLERKRVNTSAQENHLERAVALAPSQSSMRAEACLAYAKFLEHQAKRYDQALSFARQTACIEGEAGTAKRVARLERRHLRECRSSY